MSGLIEDLRCLLAAWLLEAASHMLPPGDTTAGARVYLVRAVNCLEHEMEQRHG